MKPKGYNVPLTLEERKLIEVYLKAGKFSLTHIAHLLGRGKNTVILEVKRSGGKENYNAEEAQKMYEKRREETYKNLSIRNKIAHENGDNNLQNKERIKSLEMQVEILLEEIRNLRKL